MDRIIYTAMTGAGAALQQQALLANNLANASTQGFRAEMSAFRSVPIQGPGASTRVFAMDSSIGYDDKAGPIERTGKSTDVAAKGQAWFAVQALDGTEAYTRNGALEIKPDGSLTNSSGLPVLSDAGAPITIPAGTEITIGVDGIITGKQGNLPPSTVGRLKMITTNAENKITRGEDGLFRPVTGDPLPSDPTARLQSGALEGSNVNPVETMVGMIQVARQYETQMRLIQNADNNDKTAAKLLGMG